MVITSLETIQLKEQFETAFKYYDSLTTFTYLKSFCRARVNFSCLEATLSARLRYHNSTIAGHCVKCYFAKMPMLSNEDFLTPPKPEKMFLLSPPCSPPVDWKQKEEGEPVINLELIEALSKLSPGEVHELQPPSENTPSIVIHACDDSDGYSTQCIPQTQRPPLH